MPPLLRAVLPGAVRLALAACLLAGFATSGGALAGDATVAWGTGGIGGASGRMIASATLHATEGTNAQVETIGREVVGMNRSVTSCGVCVYNTIQGERNSINGNSVSGTNAGAVSSTARFE
jgi:hypothetical protein